MDSKEIKERFQAILNKIQSLKSAIEKEKLELKALQDACPHADSKKETRIHAGTTFNCYDCGYCYRV